MGGGKIVQRVIRNTHGISYGKYSPEGSSGSMPSQIGNNSSWLVRATKNLYHRLLDTFP